MAAFPFGFPPASRTVFDSNASEQEYKFRSCGNKREDAVDLAGPLCGGGGSGTLAVLYGDSHQGERGAVK